MRKKISIILADDHTIIRKGIVEIIEKASWNYVIAEADDGATLIELYKKLKPDIIVTDLNMPVKSGLDAITELVEYDQNLKSLVLSMYDDELTTYNVWSKGAKGLIGKNCQPGELLYAIDKICDGEIYFPTVDNIKNLERFSDLVKEQKSKYDKLNINFTKREYDILTLLEKSYSSEKIADELHLSKRTVDTYRSRMLQKLGLETSEQLVIFATKYIMMERLSSNT